MLALLLDACSVVFVLVGAGVLPQCMIVVTFVRYSFSVHQHVTASVGVSHPMRTLRLQRTKMSTPWFSHKALRHVTSVRPPRRALESASRESTRRVAHRMDVPSCSFDNSFQVLPTFQFYVSVPGIGT